MHVQIFEATSHHAAPITGLLLQMGYPDEVESVTKRIEENQREGYKIFIAEANHKTTGFIAVHTYTQLHVSGLVGRIMTFCVDETLQGQGIGTQLLKRAEEFLKEQRCVKIELNCNNRRTEAHQFYSKNGYQQTSLHFVKKLT